jgi:Uma2 family endonuclease
MVDLGFFRDQRIELIHGIPVWMPPIGSLHSEIVTRLTRLFIRGLGERAVVRPQLPFVAHDDSEPEPDLAIVSPRSYATGHPDAAFLLIEVADTSLTYDRETKAPLYAASGVPQLWIVDVEARVIEVYTEPTDGAYTSVARKTESASPAAFPDIVVAVAELFT